MYAASPGAHQRYADGIFHIPLRSLYSINVNNLLLAGRTISASHVAFGASRVMATCAVIGEAAGTAAALCAEHGLTPRALAWDHFELLSRTLLRQDASVIGALNTDPEDLARTARVTASSTLRALDVDPQPTPRSSAPAEVTVTPYPLTRDVGLLLPVDPRLDAVELLASSGLPQGADLTVELWDTGLPENGVPVNHLATHTLQVPPGDPQWSKVPLAHHPERPGNVVLIVRAHRDVALALADIRRSGVLALRRKADGDAAIDHDIPEEEGQRVVEWSARELRRRSFCFRAAPASDAFAPEKAVGGYQRPYGGPQMWSSEVVADPERVNEHLQLDWDAEVELGTVHLVLDDDVDEHLNNLHRHRTPFEVMPELVRDYRLEARTPDGSWHTVVTRRDNRRRHVVHRFDEPVRTDSLRVVVEATHGARHAHVIAVRAYRA
jgi:hypothetical protein